MRTVEEHRAAILREIRVPDPIPVPLEAADGLVLAVDLRARLPLPPFDNSAMDGYAVRLADVAQAAGNSPAHLRVLADLPAGSAEDPDLPPGSCARIMTGAPLPSTAEAVVPVEATDGGTSVVRVFAPPRAGAHIRRTGEDVTVGTLVVPSGRLLGPRDVAATAASGHGRVACIPRPRVAVLSTGSELVEPGATEPLRRGLIPDSNSFLVAAAVREAGCEAVRVGAVPDDPRRLAAALRTALEEAHADVVVTTGGVSVGAYDVVKEHFQGGSGRGRVGGGEVVFSRVAMQPGKPQGFGLVEGAGGRRVPFFALPGNPVSAYVSFEVFVRPALQRMRGLPEPDWDRPVVDAQVIEAWRTPAGRRQYIPVVASRAGQGSHAGQGWSVRPTGPLGSGSHLVARLAAANALAVVEAGTDQVRPGDTVPVMLTTDGLLVGRAPG